jgi:hypothetical protein
LNCRTKYWQKKLRVLDVGANEINDMSGIEGLSELEELWVSQEFDCTASQNHTRRDFVCSSRMTNVDGADGILSFFSPSLRNQKGEQ